MQPALPLNSARRRGKKRRGTFMNAVRLIGEKKCVVGHKTRPLAAMERSDITRTEVSFRGIFVASLSPRLDSVEETPAV